jgi:hypothetical protein
VAAVSFTPLIACGARAGLDLAVPGDNREHCREPATVTGIESAR